MSAAAGRGRGVSDQDTAELPRVRRAGDWSWYAVVVAALVGGAFVVGAYVGTSHRAASAGAAPAEEAAVGGAGASPPLQMPAQAPAPARKAGKAEAGSWPPPGGYYMGASVEPHPPSTAPPIALPATATRIYYYYSLPGWPAGAKLGFRWSVEGRDLAAAGAAWHPTRSAAYARGYYELSPPGGAQTFPGGIYEVHLSGPTDLDEVGSFVVMAGLNTMMAQERPPSGVLIGPPVVSLAVDDLGRPIQAVTEVLPTAPAVYACFTYDGAPAGTVVTVRWYAEDAEVAQAAAEVRLTAGAGQAYAVLKPAAGTSLPAGAWRVAVFKHGVAKPVAETSFTVTPTAPAPPAAGTSTNPAIPVMPLTPGAGGVSAGPAPATQGTASPRSAASGRGGAANAPR